MSVFAVRRILLVPDQRLWDKIWIEERGISGSS